MSHAQSAARRGNTSPKPRPQEYDCEETGYGTLVPSSLCNWNGPLPRQECRRKPHLGHFGFDHNSSGVSFIPQPWVEEVMQGPRYRNQPWGVIRLKAFRPQATVHNPLKLDTNDTSTRQILCARFGSTVLIPTKEFPSPNPLRWQHSCVAMIWYAVCCSLLCPNKDRPASVAALGSPCRA
jgi:hypothetical protein